MKLKELTALLTPLNETSRKAVLKGIKMDGVDVTDDEGKPVDVVGLTIETSKGKEMEVEVDSPEDALKGDDEPKPDDETKAEGDDEDAKKAVKKATALDEATVTRLVAKALDAQRKAAPAPRRPIIEVSGKEWAIPKGIRSGQTKSFKGTTHGKSADERAYRFGQWCLASIAKQLPGKYDFPHAVKFTENYITKVSTEGSNTGGGVLVPEEFGNDLIDLREMYGVARKVLKIVPMSSDTRTDPKRSSGLTAYFVAEGAAGTESTKGWDQVRLTAKDLMVLSRYTSQLNEDAVINVGDDLAGEIAYAFANKEDDCAFNGTGADTYGGIVGVRVAIDNVASNAGINTQATSNTWAAIVLADFNATVAKLPQYADSPNACWVAHRAFYYGVMQKVELAAGGTTAFEVREGNRKPRPLFLGYPVEISQVYPSSTAVATIVCTLGDHGMGASFGDRRQDAIAFSEHATVGGQSVFERGQIAIRGTERFDVNVHAPGTSSVAGPIVALKTGA